AQSANTSLSNLVSPTAVNIDLLPNKDNKRDLGSSGKSWKDIHLDGSVYVGGSRFLSANTGTGTGNTTVGADAFINNTTGYSNVAVGNSALRSNTMGFGMVAVGDSALFSQAVNSNGYYNNTAVGIKAMYSNTTGWENTATGEYALYTNTTGALNTAIGGTSLYSNTTGSANTATGFWTLFYNSTGTGNTANGNAALFDNSTGSFNTAIGEYALSNNISGSTNTAVGFLAMDQHTSGYSNVAVGARSLIYSNESNLVAVGDSALYWNGFNVPAGAGLVAVGSKALFNNLSGSSNSAFGYQSLYKGTTGSYNVAAGTYAGDNLTDGSNNTFLGYNANSGTGGHIINGMALGYQASVTSNNHVVIGNSSVTSIGGFVNWSNLSDGRIKKNIKQNVPGIEFINKLQPITYNLDLEAADKIIDLPQRKAKDGKTIQPSNFEADARKAKEQIVYTGFIAQDVEKAAKSLNYDFSGVDKPDNANTLYGLRYSDFVVPLVKAVQELSAKNDDLQKQIDELKQMIVSNQSSANGQLSTVIVSASLSQNIPNPFNHITTINYTLPQQFSSAKIVVTDKSGKVLKEASLSNSKGSIQLTASTLSSGTYQYSLYVDGRLIDTKQLVVAK
ncbi:MAG TPA: tail fiber domain-containing protein, partial [Parafilimonas sp.]|nr:tail fiber domain-containing protein [Parafilimonas sp.]